MLTAGVLRRMAEQLDLDVDPEGMTGRGESPQVRDAFWAAANLAVLDAIRSDDQIRLARLYQAQVEVLRAEDKPFLELLTQSFRADLAAIDMPFVTINACGCPVCQQKDCSTVPTEHERAHPRLPHTDCAGLRCMCLSSGRPFG